MLYLHDCAVVVFSSLVAQCLADEVHSVLKSLGFKILKNLV